MPIVQQGNINTTALIVPDLYVQIVPPQNLVLNGVPTNVLGVVGTATWGPVGQAVTCSTSADYAQNFGPVQARKYDAGTPVAIAVQQGAQNFRVVRVTDGTDTAAAFQFPGTSFALSALYTGSLGNQISVSCSAGSKASSWKYVVSLPGVIPEVYDNLTFGVSANTVVPGTGYTVPPALTFPAPTLVGGTQAVGTVNLKAISATVVSGHAGTGYVTGDTVTFPGGATFTVTAAAGAVTALTLTNGGTYATAQTPANMLTTTGVGTGLQVNLVFGLGTVTMTVPGSGYVGTEGAAVVGPVTGASGGAVTPSYTVWPNLLAAINTGTGVLRGASQLVVASGTGTSVPTVGTYVFGTAGGPQGTDGASGVTAATLVGVDTLPRKGMYCLRSTGTSVALLADADDSTQWTTQAAFGLAEGIYMILTGPAGDTITNAVSVKNTVGLDTYSAKLMFGDWLWWNDQVNAVLRLVSPQGFVAGRLSNLSPEQSPLNKPLYSIAGSQKQGSPGTAQAQTYSAAELQQLFSAGIDVIANPGGGGLNIWTVRCGHNSSSNPVANGDYYTRLTNYIAATLQAGMGRYLGQTINSDLFNRIRATEMSFLSALVGQKMLAVQPDGSLPFSVVCDTSNNPQARQALGYVQSDATIRYQGINEKFIVNMQGGASVVVTRQTLPTGQVGSAS
jgi:hypothetical protein